MHLAQHHFQAQSRYFESAMHFALSSVIPSIYGLVAMELDHDALWNGTVSLLRASGIMPDGLVFDLGDSDPLPAARAVSELLESGGKGTTIYLAIPPYDPRHANCIVDGEPSAGDRRYRAETVSFYDETTGTDPRNIQVGRRNLEILGESDLPEGYVSLPVARVRPDESGHFLYDPLFVPPTLRIGSSPCLLAIVEGLIEILEAKGEALRRQLPGADTMSEKAGHELTGLWLTHAIYSGLGPLRHHAQFGRAHPRDVYEDLARLAGALCTFSLESDPRDIPLYEHDRPGEAFSALDRHIRRHLEVVIQEQYISIRLDRTAANLHTAPLTDKRALEPAEWVLRIRSRTPTATVIAEVPRKVKVCSAEDVMRLVGSAGLPALGIEHLSTLPEAIPVRVGSQYFRLLREGPPWELIRVRGSVGVYVPDSIADAELELLVVPE
jgi:type VI secretion system protein ImpJ